ncbi:inorganic pyrophosphatase [Fulvivirga lutea]|uniref:inorganic diphosphatase n=1 Tax=Fulvivirga lutea TaxID=2810512 RepID=A0A974ZZM4_9BACT|nr:inorganic pyrophosphatase [Fulvivirga lutea]QSE96295.1 inorganic pyrophosphatase [Fulvivirga lutea]
MSKIHVKSYLPHPWHGINIGAESPSIVNAFIEMTPFDSVKYEIDKTTGFIKVDRPQKFSNIVPALYGFIPQTYSAENVAELCQQKTGNNSIVGDKDPVDICVLTERNINHGNIIVPALPIGGFRMIDGGEADDKIIAILKGDEVFGDWTTIEDCPDCLINRLKHYFLTYKQMPGEAPIKKTEITHLYGKEEAYDVIRRSVKDYEDHFSVS